MDRVVRLAALFALAAAGTCGLSPAAFGAAAYETVPKRALAELKATVGQPFSAGLVFIDGKYLAPPYKVERFGTALRINGQQVSNQLIAWDEFLKTQAGAKIDRAEPEPQAAAEGPAAEETAAAPDDDGGDDIDDLFDDNPKPKKKPAKAAAKSAPRPPAPGVAEATVVFDGEFRHNVRTKTMLKKLNKARTDLEVILRKGGCCFFSPRYSTVRADRGPADIFLGAIPQVMKDNTVFEAFSAGARSRGVTFLPDAVMRDLFRNRLDYIRLMDRAKSVKDERKWESMLNSGR